MQTLFSEFGNHATQLGHIIEDMKRYMDGLLHIYDKGKGGKITSDLFKLPLEARDRLNGNND